LSAEAARESKKSRLQTSQESLRMRSKPLTCLA
jgi:hypothetical protein